MRPQRRHGRQRRSAPSACPIESPELGTVGHFRTVALYRTSPKPTSVLAEADGGECGTPDPAHAPPLNNVVTVVQTEWARSFSPRVSAARPLGRHGRSVRDFLKVENIKLNASSRPSTAFRTFGMSDRKSGATNCRTIGTALSAFYAGIF
ncbi:hypothetical protein J6590_048690 [Homalodisca vitripennis]|nr:hypothetical protein J6590_048690 [Homalodisca vitripennis]